MIDYCNAWSIHSNTHDLGRNMRGRNHYEYFILNITLLF